MTLPKIMPGVPVAGRPRSPLRHSALLGAVAMSALAGCAVGPDFKRPDAPAPPSFTAEPLPDKSPASPGPAGAAQQFAAGRDIPGEWWTLFHSEPLNSLITEALKANPDLTAAQAALRKAQEAAAAAKGAYLPSVSGSFQANRERISGAAFGTPGLSELYNLYDTSVNVSYTPDIFGQTRRQVESLEAQAEDQQFALEAAYLSLTANIATAAFQEASLRAQIAATQDIIKLERDQLDTVRQQFELGAAARSDVLLQEATLAQTEATLPPLEKSLDQTRTQLAAYVGKLPSDDIGAEFTLESLTLPDELPVSLPSKLVEQRPDIREAEAQLHDATAQVGIAIANMLPQITLTGSYGAESLTGGTLFNPSSAIWSLGAGLTQPLFKGGQLTHEKREAEAGMDEAAAQYRSTVLKAFQNVADSLHAIETDAKTLAAQTTAETSASDSFDLSRQQYALGAISYVTLLNAEKTYQQARISRVTAAAQRYADTAALLQSLGGGWWNRGDVPEDPAKSWVAVP